MKAWNPGCVNEVRIEVLQERLTDEEIIEVIKYVEQASERT